ncbi:MAG TPA: MOSC domain-containing protein, partial [Candidatus Saccharimonadales bacterium]|nr:MOSC domain-containing protein [Candidatus Saccharimonadales bacterium]
MTTETIPTGRVEAIHLATAAGEPMHAVERVVARTGGGLEGDRYDQGLGHWSAIRRSGDALTLIEAEAIEALARDHGITLAPGEARRNLTTRGIGLDALIGRTFRIGAVTAHAVRRCEPCSYLEELTGKEVLAPLVHRGGIR